jgi:transmembrane sensor
MTPSRLHYFVERYISNACTRAEFDEFFNYLVNNPDGAGLNEILKDAWLNTGIINEQEPDWNKVQKALWSSVAKDRATKRTGKYIFTRIAAVAAIAALSISIFYASKMVSTSKVATAKEAFKKTTLHEHRLIVLADGTKVWINENSELEYPDGFHGVTRQVSLRGEAFFDVAYNPSMPFVITTGKVKTTVLGTQFNIRALTSENSVTVTVKKGKVQVANEATRSIVTANQEVKINLHSNKISEGIVPESAIAPWKNNDVLLDNVTFGEFKDILENEFLVRVRFQNEQLRNCQFTFTLLRDATLDQLLTSICLVNDATYEMVNGNEVVIKGEGCRTKDLN